MSIFYLYSGIVYCILIVRHVMSVFWQHDTHGHPHICINTISHMHQYHAPRAERPQVRVGPKKSCIAMPCLPATNPVLPVKHSAHDVCHVTHWVHPVCRHMHWANSVWPDTHSPNTVLPGMHPVLPGMHWAHAVCYGSHWADNVRRCTHWADAV